MARVRAPNDRLRVLLREAGFTLEQLARAVNDVGAENGLDLHYNRSAVSHWLAGTEPRAQSAGLVAEVFSRRLSRLVSTQDAGFHAAAPPGDVVRAGMGEPVEMADAAAVLAQLAGLGSAQRAVARGVLFHTDPLAAASEQVNPGALSPTQQRRCGAERVRSARAMLRLVQMAAALSGGAAVRTALAGYLGCVIGPWLRTTRPPRARFELIQVAGRLAHHAGLASVDDELHGVAQDYFLLSLRFTRQVGDRVGYAATLSALSGQAHALHHHRQARRFAELAVQAASSMTVDLPKALLLGQLAVAAAGCGDEAVAREALTAAEHVARDERDRSRSCGGHQEASLLQLAAEARWSLGECDRAVAAMRASLARFPATSRHARMLAAVRLSEMELSRGYVEAGCVAGHLFLDHYPYLRSRRIEREISSVIRRAGVMAGHPAAAALRRRAMTLRTRKAARGRYPR